MSNFTSTLIGILCSIRSWGCRHVGDFFEGQKTHLPMSFDRAKSTLQEPALSKHGAMLNPRTSESAILANQTSDNLRRNWIYSRDFAVLLGLQRPHRPKFYSARHRLEFREIGVTLMRQDR
jgi:hypothetical protein